MCENFYDLMGLPIADNICLGRLGFEAPLCGGKLIISYLVASDWVTLGEKFDQIGKAEQQCDVIVVNIGLHYLHGAAIAYEGNDAEILDDVETAAAKAFLTISKFASIIHVPQIWLSLAQTRVVRMPSNFYDALYSNESILKFNENLEEVLASMGIPMLWIWEMSKGLGIYQYHADGVHMGKDGNWAKARMLADFLATGAEFSQVAPAVFFKKR